MARAMKDSGIEWIGEIPEEWVCCKQKYLLQLINGRAYKDSEFEEDGRYRILRVGNLFSNPVWYTSSLELPADKYCDNGDLLYAWSMSYAPVIWQGEKVIYHYHIWKTILSDGIEKQYAYYYLLSLTDAIKAEVHETTMGFITMGIMNNSYIAHPSIEEQGRIAQFLDAKCAEIDALMADVQAQIETLEQYKRSVITEAVTKGLNPNVPMKDSGTDWMGMVPRNWVRTRIKYCLCEIDMRSITGKEEPLSMSQRFGIIPTSQIDVPHSLASYVGAKITHPGDLVFNKLKAHLGVFSVSQYTGLVSPDYAVYRAYENVNAKYLEYLFKTDACIAEFKKRITGVGQGLSRLYTSDLFAICVAIPQKVEQDTIVKMLDAKCAEIDTIIDGKRQQLSTLEEYKKSVIFEYVTGKKEVPVA